MKSTPRYQPNALPYLAKVRVAVSNTVVRSTETPALRGFLWFWAHVIHAKLY